MKQIVIIFLSDVAVYIYWLNCSRLLECMMWFDSGLQVREWHNVSQVELEFAAVVYSVPSCQSVADRPCR